MSASQFAPETYEKHVGRKGDLICELHYVDFGGPRNLGTQAAFKIYNANGNGKPVFIPLCDAWRYVENEALHTIAPQLCEHLYGVLTKDGCFRIIDLMMDYMDDLIKSKVTPKRLREDKSLAGFLQRCDDAGIEFTAFVNDKQVIG